MIVNSVYHQLNKSEVPGKAKRTPCMAKVVSFEKAYDEKEIKLFKEFIKQGDVKVISSIDKAVYMSSTLFDSIDMEYLDNHLTDIIKSYGAQTLNKNSKNTIEYIVFENDKEDPKKKSDSCKLYRGYVVMKFKNGNNRLIYQNQIDFMDNEGKDIPQTIKCAVEAFLTY